MRQKGQRKSKSKINQKTGDDDMNMSNIIANMILDMLKEDGETEIQRNELAQEIGCVPSQINYVISSRFTPEQGYTVESRRGGGGYIRIRKVNIGNNNYIMHVINAIGDEISYSSAAAMLSNMVADHIITPREQSIILSAISDRIIPFNSPVKDNYRAKVLKNMLISLN